MTPIQPPARVLLCLGPCHGEYYLPLGPDDRIACIHDATHPVAIYQTPTIHAGEADPDPDLCEVCGAGPSGRCDPPDEYDGDCPHVCSPER